MRVRLRSRRTAESAVVSADAAATELGQIGVVGDEYRQGIGNDLGVLADVGLELAIEPVDVSRSDGDAELVGDRSISGWNSEGQSRQGCRLAQQNVVPSLSLYGAPEVPALKRVNVLSGAHVHAAGL